MSRPPPVYVKSTRRAWRSFNLVDFRIQYTSSARPVFALRKHSPDGASTKCGGEHLIAAHYSFIDPEKMKGWVGLDLTFAKTESLLFLLCPRHPALVLALQSSLVGARHPALVLAWQSSLVGARHSALVLAWQSSLVGARNSALVLAWHSSLATHNSINYRHVP